MAQQEKEYLSVDDVAKRLDVSTATVYQWIRKDKLKHLKAGKLVRIPREALDEMLGVGAGPIEAETPEDYESKLVDQLGQILRRIIREEMRA